VDMIYFDFAEAFDSVPHTHLTKLKLYGLTGNLLRWFISNNTFHHFYNWGLFVYNYWQQYNPLLKIGITKASF